MRYFIAAALITTFLPTSGIAATVPPLELAPPRPSAGFVTYWYLGAEPRIAEFPRINRNQGYMVVEADRAGQRAAGFTGDIGNPPFSTGPDLGAAFTMRGDPFAVSWDVTFDGAGDPVRWNFMSGFRFFEDFAVIDWREGDSLTFPLVPFPDDPDSGGPKVVFDAPPGDWYRNEAAYVAAAREAGVAPIPLPAAAWLLAAGLAGLGLLGRRKRT